MFSETLLIAAYGLVPVISTGAFVPQIVALAKSDGELKNFSFAAWSTWLLSAIISVFYGVFYLQDFMFILASSVACFFNVIIITLAAYKALGRPRFKIDARIDHHIDNITHQMHDQRDQRKDIQRPQNDRIITVNNALIAQQPQTIQ